MYTGWSMSIRFSGGSSSGGYTPPAPLVDFQFDTLPPADWLTGPVSVSGGNMVFTVPTGASVAELYSPTSIGNIADHSFTVKYVDPPTTSTGDEFWMAIYTASNTSPTFVLTESGLVARWYGLTTTTNVTVNWDPDYKFWQIVELAGVFLWRISKNGVEWKTVRSVQHGSDLSTNKIDLYTSWFSGSTGKAPVVIDSLTVAPTNWGVDVASQSAAANLELNVKDFGALGDGVHDDRPACQSAIDAANSLFTSSGSRVTVVFPSGTYYLSRPPSNIVYRGSYHYAHLLIRSGVNIFGNNTARVLLQPLPTTVTTADITTPATTVPVASTAKFSPSISLNQLQFAGDPQDTVGFTVASATSFTVPTWQSSGLVIPAGTAVVQRVTQVAFLTDPASIVTDWSIRGMSIDGNSTEAVEAPQHGVQICDSDRFTIFDNEFKRLLGKPIYGLSNLAHVNSHFNIARNTIRDCASNAISLDSGGYAFTVVDNDVYGCRIVAESMFCGSNTQPARWAIIERNRFNSWGTIDLTGSQIKLNDNFIESVAGQAGPGVRFHGGTDIQIHGNTVDMTTAGASSGAIPLRFEDLGCTDLNISNNNIITNNGQAVQMQIGPAANQRSRRVNFSNNKVTQVNSSSTGGGIDFHYVDAISFTNNTVECVSTVPKILNIALATQAVVSGNTFTNMLCYVGAAKSIVSDNSVSVTLGTGRTDQLIRILANDCIVIGNSVSGIQSAPYGLINMDSASNTVVAHNSVAVTLSFGTAIGDTGSSTNNTIKDNILLGANVQISGAAGSIIAGNTQWVTENGGVASKSNGQTIAHGLRITPGRVSVTASVAKHIASVTAVDGTNLTIALYDDTGAAVTVAENVYWEARR